MKLERRGDGAADPENEARTDGEAQAPPSPADAGNPGKPANPAGGHKPVLVYIMVLFIVAFLLMALSLFMHQRSNAEVIGTLQSSVTTMQEIQAAKDENIRLQEELRRTQKELDELRLDMEETEDAIAAAKEETDALLALYTLQQQYAARDLDGCRETIRAMEDAGQDALLPREGIGAVTSPAGRYQQLKDAIESVK